jgi:hypothetical protein
MSCLTEYTMKLSCHEHVEGTCFIVDLNLPGEYFFFIVCLWTVIICGYNEAHVKAKIPNSFPGQ